MALSEIEMYKKAHESLSENLTHANKKAQQFKAERDLCLRDIGVLRKKHEALKANENSLWRSSRDFECERDEIAAKVSMLERDNKDLRLQSDTYFEQWQALKDEIKVQPLLHLDRKRVTEI